MWPLSFRTSTRIRFQKKSLVSLLLYGAIFILTSSIMLLSYKSHFAQKHIGHRMNGTWIGVVGSENISSALVYPIRLIPTIPKIIHQTYVSGDIDGAYKQYISGCLKLNPDWQYYLWRDEDIVAFIRDHFPDFMRKYNHFHLDVQRGDSIRYMVLHHFGGIYVDMDVECVKPFFPSLANHAAFVDQEAREHAGILYSRDFTAMNSAMGSVRNHPFFLRMVRAMMEVDDRVTGAGDSTGPDLLTAELTKWRQRSSGNDSAHDVTLLEPEIFSPLVDHKQHNFRTLCDNILRDASQEPSDAGERRRKSLRVRTCRNFARDNWPMDKSGPSTVGRHLFLHLGYFHKRGVSNRFRITELKKDTMFYGVHRMKPT